MSHRLCNGSFKIVVMLLAATAAIVVLVALITIRCTWLAGLCISFRFAGGLINVGRSLLFDRLIYA